MVTLLKEFLKIFPKLIRLGHLFTFAFIHIMNGLRTFINGSFKKKFDITFIVENIKKLSKN